MTCPLLYDGVFLFSHRNFLILAFRNNNHIPAPVLLLLATNNKQLSITDLSHVKSKQERHTDETSDETAEKRCLAVFLLPSFLQQPATLYWWLDVINTSDSGTTYCSLRRQKVHQVLLLQQDAVKVKRIRTGRQFRTCSVDNASQNEIKTRVFQNCAANKHMRIPQYHVSTLRSSYVITVQWHSFGRIFLSRRTRWTWTMRWYNYCQFRYKQMAICEGILKWQYW